VPVFDELEGQQCLTGSAFPEKGSIAGLPQGQTVTLMAKLFHRMTLKEKDRTRLERVQPGGPGSDRLE